MAAKKDKKWWQIEKKGPQVEIANPTYVVPIQFQCLQNENKSILSDFFFK
jgi:hypothetical protein